MKKEREHLPIFGIGPIYIIVLLIITVFAVIINYLGLISDYQILKFRIINYILGFLFIIEGLIVWILAVLISRIDSKIKDSQLVTNGIYKFVRNPIYSAFIFVFTGVLLLNMNYLLLLLPFLYWISLTILMKKTEEKWLMRKFGKNYIEYCSRTNRCIPFFPKKVK